MHDPDGKPGGEPLVQIQIPQPISSGRARHLIIAGGGISGLASALALARRGIGSTILERRSAFSEAGAGIQIGPNGTRILDWLGVSDLLRPHVAAPEAIEVHDARGDGRLLTRLPLGTWIAERHGSPYWVVRREDLHAALLARVNAEPLIALTMGSHATGARPIGDDAIEIEIADGGRLQAQGLIAADGVWSTLRAHVAGTHSEPRFAGKAAARTLISDAVPPGFERLVVGVWMHAGVHVVHYPVNAGASLAVIVIGRDGGEAKDWSRPAPADWVAERTGKLAPRLRELLTRAPAWRLAPLVELPTLRRFNADRIALVGDAAHPIMPFLAQGGVLALEDAAVLAQAVASVDDLRQAFRAYSDARQGRARRVARASQRNGAIYHLANAGAALRNAALGAVPGQHIMARYDWLYGARAVP